MSRGFELTSIPLILFTDKTMKEPIITEGIAGMWHYHLSDPDKPGVSLCGKPTMRSNMPLSMWGTKGNKELREYYCEKCASLRQS